MSCEPFSNHALAQLGEQTSREVAQCPVVVNIRTQAQLTTDDARHDGGDEVVELER